MRSVGLGGLDVDGVGMVMGEVIVISGKGKDVVGDVLFEVVVYFLGCWWWREKGKFFKVLWEK